MKIRIYRLKTAKSFYNNFFAVSILFLNFLCIYPEN